MKHGTTSGYKTHGCRCRKCTDAVVAYQREYNRRRRESGPVMVDSAEASNHIKVLTSTGVTMRAVSRTTGLSPTHVRQICSGEIKRLHPKTADAIMSIRLGTLDGAGAVDGARARRLITAMSECDISQCDIARALKYENTKCLALSRRKYVMRRSWDRLVLLYTYYARQGLVPASVLDEVGALGMETA